MRLVLVRHGVAEDQHGRAVGHCDTPLSDQGRAEVETLVAKCVERPARVVSSDLRRARGSAEILTRPWGLALRSDARLREMHFGQWEGRAWQELEQADTERLRRWMADWITTRTPGGESFADVVARTSAWLEEWSSGDPSAAGTTVVVAHAGSIRAILCRLLRVPLEEAFGFEVGHARVTVVDLAGIAPRVVLANADAWSEAASTPEPVALGRIPPPSRNRVCICARCAELNPEWAEPR